MYKLTSSPIHNGVNKFIEIIRPFRRSSKLKRILSLIDGEEIEKESWGI
jgi:hypothetical protein